MQIKQWKVLAAWTENGHLILPEVYIENFSEYSKIVERGVEFADIHPSFVSAVSSASGNNNSIIKCSEIDFAH